MYKNYELNRYLENKKFLNILKENPFDGIKKIVKEKSLSIIFGDDGFNIYDSFGIEEGRNKSSEFLANIDIIKKEFYSQIDLISSNYKENINLDQFKILFEKIIHKYSEFYQNVEKELLLNTLFQRTKELKSFPDKTETILKMTISYVHEIFPDVFNLEEEKNKIFKHDNIKYINQDNSIISNIDGEIKSITFNLSNYSKNFSGIVAQIIKSKKNNKNFEINMVYENEEDKIEFQNYLKMNNIKNNSPNIWFLNPNSIKGEFTIWARDSSVILNNKTIITSNHVNYIGNKHSMKSLIPKNGINLKQSKLCFEGGNLRATKNYLFVGYSNIKHTIVYDITGNLYDPWNKKHAEIVSKIGKKQINQTVEKFEKEFGKKVILIGEGKLKQDIFHIDMGITPIDEENIIIAEGKFKKDVKKLQEMGFKIHSIPYYISGKTQYTYNNVLIEKYNENGKDIKKVYLPQYYGSSRDNFDIHFSKNDLNEMNKKAVNIYKNLGFKVIPIKIPTDLILLGGSLNCITFEER